MRRNSLVVWSYSQQPSGHQVLAYRNVMHCKWPACKTARPQNGGRLAAQIRATKIEGRQSAFTFCGLDLVLQEGRRFGAVSVESIRKNHHYYLATALLRRNLSTRNPKHDKYTLEAHCLENMFSRTCKFKSFTNIGFVDTPAVGSAIHET
jgi:hypothetical protein